MEAKDLVGQIIEVIVNGDTKQIFVKDVFTNSKGHSIIIDSNGNTYDEDDINWSYRLTLGACLMTWLAENNYISFEEALSDGVDKYERQIKDLFNLLIKQGYIANDEQ